MVLVIRALVLLLLASVFIQDLKSRAVYWFLFPLLSVLLIIEGLLNHYAVSAIFHAWAMNMLFLLPQLLLLNTYFCLKAGRWVSITDGLLGWGDVLLLVSMGFYLSLPVFILFYLSSLVLVILVWFVWQLFTKTKNQSIPLAGFQALLLGLVLTFTWVFHRPLSSDDALLPILNLWN